MPARLAWFTTLSPARSGVSPHCAELLPALARGFAIDVFVEAPRGSAAEAAGALDAHDFVWKHARRPYDLVVYQLDSSCRHDYLWAYLCRYPGLVALHDGEFHRARARTLLSDRRPDDYRAELAYSHPRAPRAVAELGVRRLLGSFAERWPMRRPVLDAARAALVHDEGLAAAIRREAPGLPLERLDFGVGPAPPDGCRRATVRRRLGVPDGALLVAAFGRPAPDTGLPATLRALAARAGAPPWRLVLCGPPAAWRDAPAEAQRLGLGRRVQLAGPPAGLPSGLPALEDLPAMLAAADVCICLRWPSPRETRSAWLRCLAAGKPTLVADLVAAGSAPLLDPHDWRVAPGPAVREAGCGEPAGVCIEAPAEDRALALAVPRLIADAALRRGLGAAARRLWQTRFTLQRMAAGYARIIEDTCRRPFDERRRRRLPAHLRSDGAEGLRAVLDELGASPPDPFRAPAGRARP